MGRGKTTLVLFCHQRLVSSDTLKAPLNTFKISSLDDETKAQRNRISHCRRFSEVLTGANSMSERSFGLRVVTPLEFRASVS